MFGLRRRTIATALLACLTTASAAGEIGGTKPTYTDRPLSATPLDQLIVARHWAPGIDEGFVPQGLTFAQGRILLGAYRSIDKAQSRGPARVFAVDPHTGAVTGGFDLPPAIGHADGLAASADGNLLWLADNSRTLWEFDLPRSLAAGTAVANGRRALKGDPAIGANLLTYDGQLLWFGRYARQGTPMIVGVLPATLFNGTSVPFDAAGSRRLPLPLAAQGAVFDHSGNLWISTSGGRQGRLYRLDVRDGRVLQELPAVAGIEDLACDEQGRLWAASEAGSRRWSAWSTYYPLLFAFVPR